MHNGAQWKFETLLPLKHVQVSSDDSQTSCGHWLPWRNTGYYFSWQSIKFCSTLKFYMGVNGKIVSRLECAVSSKRLTVE